MKTNGGKHKSKSSYTGGYIYICILRAKNGYTQCDKHTTKAETAIHRFAATWH